MSTADAPSGSGEIPDHSSDRRFTIAEIAAAADVPARRIRYYQSEGLLPPPQLVGRTGFYGMDHFRRLRQIVALRNRGLNLPAIRELLDAPEEDPESTVRRWLTTADLIQPWSRNRPRTATRAEIEVMIDGLPADTLERLVFWNFLGPVAEDGSGAEGYVIRSPELLHMVLGFERDQHVRIEVGAMSGVILAKHLSAMSDELIRFYLDQLGTGIEVPDEPESAATVVDGLRESAERAVALWFNICMDRAIERAAAAADRDLDDRS